jgi:2TM domain
MPIETLMKNERAVQEGFPGLEPKRQDTLRTRALERIYRLRAFTVHLIVFAIGLPIIGAVWVLTEYFEEHTWPDRFASAPDVAGTWDPWFFFVAGIWAIILVAHGLRAYFGPPVGPIQRYVRRPATDAEINRAIERIRR